MGQNFPFQATIGNVRSSNKRTFAIGLTKSRVSPSRDIPDALPVEEPQCRAREGGQSQRVIDSSSYASVAVEGMRRAAYPK
jgi:hypothetical protein